MLCPLVAGLIDGGSVSEEFYYDLLTKWHWHATDPATADYARNTLAMCSVSTACWS